MMEEYLIRVDSYDFDERINSPAALVYFYNHMEPACRGFDEIMEELAQQYEDMIPVLAVDTEQSPDIAERYGIESVPYVIMFVNGVPAADIEGANLPDVYADMIEANLPGE